MNYIDYYIKQLADYNMWVRIPTLLIACVAATEAFGYCRIRGLIIFTVIGLLLAAANNYYNEY